MKINQQKKPLPFQISQLPKKQKKKSIVSQKIKQRKQLEKIKQQNKPLKKYQDQQSSQDQYPLHRKPKNIQAPQFQQHINYITLQEFQGLLEDQRTLQAYQKAISNNAHLFASKIVLHLTSGCNCYYSIFAAEAGASKVYCVVNGHSITQQQNVWMMQQIIRQNKLHEIIQVLSWKDFNAQIDVIIGQPMGFCMHYDGLIDRMIEARDLYLDKKNGVILPDKLKLKCALIRDEHFFDKKIQFWNQVYGIPMTSMQKWISNQPIIKTVDPSLIISNIQKFIQFDLYSASYQQIQQIRTQFKLKTLQDTEANGISFWFEIQFNCEGQKSQLKASPWQNATKYTHVTLYMNTKLKLKSDQQIKIKIYGKKYPHHGVSVMKLNIANTIENVYTFSD